ncbi:hypothetical protein N7540_011085 [Penicillium herquei]|nr:hypothetical protein N7540_011085 [Penicillium herquei]
MIRVVLTLVARPWWSLWPDYADYQPSSPHQTAMPLTSPVTTPAQSLLVTEERNTNNDYQGRIMAL